MRRFTHLTVHIHHLQPAAVLGQVHNEVVTPDVVFVLCPPPRASVLALAQEEKTPPLALFLGHFETFLAPQPMHPLLVDRPTFAPQHRPHSTVAVAGVLPRELDHPFGQPAVPLFAPCGPRSADSIWAGRSPRTPDAQRRPQAAADKRAHVLDGSPPPGLNLRSFPGSPP